MSTLQQLREGMDRAWETLQAGWRTLTQKATQALTLFRPGERDDDDDECRALRAASPGWGLLAAEVREDDGEICVRLEAPGLEPDQFDIQVLERILVISGEKHIAREERRGRYHVTERAYQNPKFVEDIVRDVAQRLLADPNITWFSVSAENFESIHNHSAYAHITSGAGGVR